MSENYDPQERDAMFQKGYAQGANAKLEKQTPQEYWKDFPEAPFSTSFKWLDANGFEQLTTLRGWQFSSLFRTIGQAEEIITSNGGTPINNQPKPLPASANTIPVRDENGTPVVDADRNPVMTSLPDGVHLFKVAGLAHDKTKTGKDVLKVWTVEEPYSKGYGVSCFHPPAEVGDWKAWQLMSRENKTRYMPPKGFELVLIRDPQKEGGYPDVIEFRAA
jgi:hypothetical protein